MTGSEGIAPTAAIAAGATPLETGTSGDPAADDRPTHSISRREAWTNFAFLASWSYLLYGIGYATPYLRSELKLSDFEAGLHGSFLAVGVLAAGLGVDWLARRIGSRWVFDVAVVGLTIGVAFFALAPVLGVSLTGSLFLGFAGGTLGTQVNVNLSRSDSATSRRLLSQANAICMLTAGAAPLAMGISVDWLGMWRIAMVLPVLVVFLLTAVRSRCDEGVSTVRLPRAKLPGVFWLVWLVIVLAVSIEFSFVFWGSTIVSRQTGLADKDATVLASLFVAGMFVGRLLLGRGLGAGTSPRLVLSGGLAVVIVGASLVWLSHAVPLSALGLFVGGAGTAGLFPIGLNFALDRAPHARYEAAARVTLASGVAVLLAPSVLGLASDIVGVSTAWPIILLLAVGALGVLAVTPSD